MMDRIRMPLGPTIRWRCVVVMMLLITGVASGCSGKPTNVYSWKPQAATAARSTPRPTTRPVEVRSTMAGADLLDESHRATLATWVAVPSRDGKKTVWVQVK